MSNSLSTTLPATGYATVLPREIINGSDADVVDANVDVVNAMYAELLDIGEIAPNALRSYYVDFYLTQALGGGFAQYVFTAPEREDIDAYIRAGLEGHGGRRAPGPLQPHRGRLRRPLRGGGRRVP